MKTLASFIESTGRLDVTDAVAWVVRLCKRVEQLHELGVAHGGLSAECILAAEPGGSSAGTLADIRNCPRRPGYYSPERHGMGEVSVADDTWALAVTLYYAMTGQFPFTADAVSELDGSGAVSAPRPLAAFQLGEDALQAVFDRFLRIDFAERVVGVKRLREALEESQPDKSLGQLPPLEEAEDDDGFDGDFEDVKTVMRDTSELRQQLEQLGGVPEAVSGPAAMDLAGPGVAAQLSDDPPAAPPAFGEVAFGVLDDDDDDEDMATVVMTSGVVADLAEAHAASDEPARPVATSGSVATVIVAESGAPSANASHPPAPPQRAPVESEPPAWAVPSAARVAAPPPNSGQTSAPVRAAAVAAPSSQRASAVGPDMVMARSAAEAPVVDELADRLLRWLKIASTVLVLLIIGVTFLWLRKRGIIQF